MDVKRILDDLRASFLQLPTSKQLGNIASELNRMKNWVRSQNVHTQSQIRICMGLVEFCAPGLLPDRVDDAASLVDIQRELARWYWNWDKIQNDLAKRQELAKQAQEWSDQVLAMSGLLEQE